MDQESKPAKAPNIRDVARLAGVSYQTVSRVLNGSSAIRAETRARVEAAIAELDYKPNVAARALASKRSGTIGVLIATHVASYGVHTMVLAIGNAANEHGMHITITSCGSDPESVYEALERLTAQAVDGVIVVAPQVRVFDALAAQPRTMPVIALDSSQHATVTNVAVDQRAGARLAVRHLIALGHKDILHIAGPQDWIEAELRMQGYLDELLEHDLPVIPPILGDWTSDFGYRALTELISRRDFTAIFVANDQMAMGVLHGLHDVGVRVPHDMSVVSFDDNPESAHTIPPLTSVRQDFRRVGHEAVERLIAELAGAAPGGVLLVEPTLTIRASTAPPSR